MANGSTSSPTSLDAERFVLGSFFRDPSLLTLHGHELNPADFYAEKHQHLLAAMKAVSERGEPLDEVMVSEELSKYAQLESVGGPAYIQELLDTVGTTAGLSHHMKVVKDKSKLRQMIHAATEIASDGYASDIDVVHFLDEAEKKIFEVVTSGARSTVRSVGEVLHEAIETIQANHRDGGEISGLATGFDRLDELTLGLQRSDLIILAARPAMGKTALAMSMATNIAMNSGKSVAVFSLEMSADQLAMRMLSSEAHVDLKSIRSGRLSMDDFRKLTAAMGQLSEAKLFIDDTPALSLPEIWGRARRLALDGKCDLVIVDYLQLMGTSARISSREQQISELSRGLKGLAKELQIPVIALSQLNRSLESRQDKRPILSDLRESGAIEQDADVILFVYRDEYYQPDTDDKGVAEVIIGKQRNGPTGTSRLAFVGRYTKFGNLSANAEF